MVDFDGFERMHNFILQTQENFKIIDRNGDGKLSRTEVETALEQAGTSRSSGPACPPVTITTMLRHVSVLSVLPAHTLLLKASYVQDSVYHSQLSDPSSQPTTLHAWGTWTCQALLA